MPAVVAPDGTNIAYRQSGAGAPLILVHGTGTNASRWASVLPALAMRFTVYLVERRGRGDSGDARAYAIEREFEDIAAVVASAPQPANLLGHSFGALCALGAALLARNLRRLILYEPAFPLDGGALYPAGMLDRMQKLLDSGDNEGVLRVMYRELAQMPAEDFERLRESPSWPARLAAAHTVVRESWAEERFVFEARRFANLRVPTLLLTGSNSPMILSAAAAVVCETLPDCRVAVMPGQQHFAMDTAPALFVQEVTSFLLGPA